jgi:hypothetical protein
LRARAISLYLFITSLDTVLNIASLAGDRVSVGGEPQVPGIWYPSMINGQPVVAAPAEIDVTTAEKLQTVLDEAAANGHAVIVISPRSNGSSAGDPDRQWLGAGVPIARHSHR